MDDLINKNNFDDFKAGRPRRDVPAWSSRFKIAFKQQLINAFILKFTQNNPYQKNVNFTF